MSFVLKISIDDLVAYHQQKLEFKDNNLCQDYSYEFISNSEDISSKYHKQILKRELRFDNRDEIIEIVYVFYVNNNNKVLLYKPSEFIKPYLLEDKNPFDIELKLRNAFLKLYDDKYKCSLITDDSSLSLDLAELNKFDNLSSDLFEELVEEFCNAKYESLFTKKNNDTITYPFQDVRQGQLDMAEFIANNENKIYFIQASTGIGKTAGVLIPHLKKYLEDNQVAKVFYLTSKNSIKGHVVELMEKVSNNRNKLKTISLSSKSSLCCNHKQRCYPKYCRFIKEYESRKKGVIDEIVSSQNIFKYDDFLDLGIDHNLCPFELQLDISLSCNLIICDYNHVFDPIAKLERYFKMNEYPYYLLVDECHNLPSRVAACFSATINLDDLLNVMSAYKTTKPYSISLVRLINYFRNFNDCRDYDDYFKPDYKYEFSQQFLTKELLEYIEDFRKDLRKYLLEKTRSNSELESVLYELNSFLAVRNYDEKKFVYIFNIRDGVIHSISVECLDSSEFIYDKLKRFNKCCLFSATLSPKNYYTVSCGCDLNTPFLNLSSPFDPKNQLIMYNPTIDLSYKNRLNSIQEVIENIEAVVESKKGNYFVFVPSFEYLQVLKSRLYDSSSVKYIFQESNMSEGQRENFISNFDRTKSYSQVGVVVLGGIFSEGIDLVGEKLIGAIIISIGLAQFNAKNMAVCSYHSENMKERSLGYLFAFVYPGMNKVLQASGRVIRTENDRGVIYFIEQRYADKIQQDNLNSNFKSQIIKINKIEELKNTLNKFWKGI